MLILQGTAFLQTECKPDTSNVYGWMPQPLLVGLIQPGQTMVRAPAGAKIHACCGLMHPSGLIQPEGLLHLLPEGLIHPEGLIQPEGVPSVRSASRAGVP